MRRRKFFRFLGGLAAAPVVWPRAAEAAPASPSVPPAPAPEPAPAAGFGQPGPSYAQFCATPEDQRVFYAVREGKIVAEKLNPAHWRPTGWGDPPELPVAGGSHDGVPMESPYPNLYGEGPFRPTWDSLLQYECPEWYRDAKFGIWNHWSPQCVPEDGDWYARNMYLPGQGQYKNQLAHYGPPSRFGYKDLVAQWTLLNWNPSELMDRYVKAGAKFFIALANHHDGFDTWASRHHEWNAARLGPHRDVVGTWAAEARKRGLRLGATVHQARNWWWFQPSHGADASGPYAGRPYDGELTRRHGKGQWWEGLDPQQLYSVKHPHNALPDISYVKNFYDRTRDLMDQHHPDLLYFDNPLFPLGWGGMNIGAYVYNQSLRRNQGRMENVITIKMVPPRLAKSVVADIERGLAGGILPYPWQSETCIGEWHYQRKLFDQPGEFGGYMHPREVIHWLVDTVSKNGTFILNIPGKPDGTIDRKEEKILEKIGEWFALNGEAIYGTRPWKVFGEGPHMIKAGSFQGASIRDLDARDIRFTRNKAGHVIYAFALGEVTKPVLIQSFGLHAETQPGKIARVRLLGSGEPLRWRQSARELRIEPPRHPPAPGYATVFEITLA